MKLNKKGAQSMENESPLTRGAWIEIPREQLGRASRMSPLTRGAWIEMRQSRESPWCCGRPSHEGRGLKSQANLLNSQGVVAPHTRGVD